jgi:hypothetical protein
MSNEANNTTQIVLADVLCVFSIGASVGEGFIADELTDIN